MDNKFTRRFQVMEPKTSSEYRIRVYADEYEKYIDESKESFVGESLYFVVNIERIRKGYFQAEGHFEGELLTHCSRCRDNSYVDLSESFSEHISTLNMK